MQVAAEMTRIYQRIFTKNSCLGHINRLASKGLIERRADYKPQKRVYRTGEGSEKKWRTIPRKPVVVADVLSGQKKVKNGSAKKRTISNVISFAPRTTTDDSAKNSVPLELASGCMFAVSQTKQGVHLFCNAEKRQGSSYCADHHRLCYVPVPARVIRPQFRMPQ